MEEMRGVDGWVETCRCRLLRGLFLSGRAGLIRTRADMRQRDMTSQFRLASGLGESLLADNMSSFREGELCTAQRGSNWVPTHGALQHLWHGLWH